MTSIEALTHTAVLHRSEMLNDEAVEMLVVRAVGHRLSDQLALEAGHAIFSKFEHGDHVDPASVDHTRST